MQTYFIKKHAIFGNDSKTLLAQFSTYREGIAELAQAVELAASLGLDVQFGVKLTVDEQNIKHKHPELLNEIFDARRSMPRSVVDIYDPKVRGVGVSTQQILFNPAFMTPTGVIVDADYDQTIFHTKDALAVAVEFCQKMVRDNALLGVESRDVPVRLATNERNSDLRIMHELVHSIAIGIDKLHLQAHPDHITPAYAAIGESTTGLTAVNTMHPRHADFVSGFYRAAKHADLRGYATPYFCALFGSQLGPITTGYVASKPNAFYAMKSEKEERMSIVRMIHGQTRELGRTEVRGMLEQALADPLTVPLLNMFYPLDDVRFVCGLMKKGLSDSWARQ